MSVIVWLSKQEGASVKCIDNILKRKVYEYVIENFKEKIDVYTSKTSMPLYNKSCHYNADAIVEAGNAFAVVECFVVDGNSKSVFLHYINMDHQMKFFDATLGYRWSGCDYRFSKLITRSTSADPYDILLARKKEVCGKAGLIGFVVNRVGVHNIL